MFQQGRYALLIIGLGSIFEGFVLLSAPGIKPLDLNSSIASPKVMRPLERLLTRFNSSSWMNFKLRRANLKVGSLKAFSNQLAPHL